MSIKKSYVIALAVITASCANLSRALPSKSSHLPAFNARTTCNNRQACTVTIRW